VAAPQTRRGGAKRASTAPGLQVSDRRVCDQNSNADAFVTPWVRHSLTRAATRHSVGGDAISRPTAERRPHGVRSSVRDAVVRRPPSDRTGIRAAISSPLSGGLVSSCILAFSAAHRRPQFTRLTMRKTGFHRDIRARVLTNGPPRSSACRPAVFHTLTALPAPSVLAQFTVTLSVLSAKGSG